MKYTIVNSEPPKTLLAKCQKKFGDNISVENNFVFTYGDKIYAKYINLPPEIIKHETVHIIQQKAMGKTKWWDKYLKDDKFRLDQELEAHKAEYKTYCEIIKDRNKQSIYKNHIAIRLSSPMYGKLITKQEALKLIC